MTYGAQAPSSKPGQLQTIFKIVTSEMLNQPIVGTDMGLGFRSGPADASMGLGPRSTYIKV
jgi:hypothetical protein